MKRWLTLFLLLLFSSVTLSGKAEGDIVSKEMNFAIHYRFDDVTFDPDYLDNRRTADLISGYLLESPRIDSIIVYSWSSPEGSYLYNARLSRERAKTAVRFLLDHSPDSLKLNSEKIRISPIAENWEGLKKLVEENYRRSDKDEILQIISDETISVETKKWRLQQLDGGFTWRYLLGRYMPQLRSATWICIWAETIDPMPEVYPLLAYARTIDPPLTSNRPLAIDPPLTAARPENVTRGGQGKPVIAALRTNLLVPALNIGAEYPIGTSWSVGADYYFPWFRRNASNKNCFQLLGWNLEGRYWFGKDRTPGDALKGHSVGLNASAGYYDIERNFKGNQGMFAAVIADYLYSLPVFNDKLHLEFTLGLGYIYSQMRPYEVFEEGGKAYKLGYKKNFNWLGPTKAAVSLVFPIRPDMFKSSRRGER